MLRNSLVSLFKSLKWPFISLILYYLQVQLFKNTLLRFEVHYKCTPKIHNHTVFIIPLCKYEPFTVCVCLTHSFHTELQWIHPDKHNQMSSGKQPSHKRRHSNTGSADRDSAHDAEEEALSRGRDKYSKTGLSSWLESWFIVQLSSLTSQTLTESLSQRHYLFYNHKQMQSRYYWTSTFKSACKYSTEACLPIQPHRAHSGPSVLN